MTLVKSLAAFKTAVKKVTFERSIVTLVLIAALPAAATFPLNSGRTTNTACFCPLNTAEASAKAPPETVKLTG